jgi:hypothetical protein
MTARALLAAALLSVLGCRTGQVSNLTGAITMTALAVGASAASRAAGGCIAVCTGGTACNPRTGLCEVLPCRNLCSPNEHCEQSYAGDKCMPGAQTGVESLAKGTKPNIPAVVPANVPPSSSGAPTIVPTAEQQPPK